MNFLIFNSSPGRFNLLATPQVSHKPVTEIAAWLRASETHIFVKKTLQETRRGRNGATHTQFCSQTWKPGNTPPPQESSKDQVSS